MHKIIDNFLLALSLNLPSHVKVKPHILELAPKNMSTVTPPPPLNSFNCDQTKKNEKNMNIGHFKLFFIYNILFFIHTRMKVYYISC